MEGMTELEALERLTELQQRQLRQAFDMLALIGPLLKMRAPEESEAEGAKEDKESNL